MVDCLSHIFRRTLFLLAIVICLSGVDANRGATRADTATNKVPDSAPQLNTSERQELNLYREYLPQLANDLNISKMCGDETGSDAKAKASYAEYLVAFYKGATEIRKMRQDMYAWQVFAGNLVLFVVVLMSVGGFFITIFQIYQLYRMNIVDRPTTIDISLHRIQLTTSITGVLVLIISFLFLLIFLHEVYLIRPLVPESHGTQTLSQLLQAPE
jgi:hypothetical protein